ncbi:MAG: metallopeptidase [DPANN group archaeon]|nr:metallopeptidase [DPANN group archaeon]
MKIDFAPDIKLIAEEIIRKLDLDHIDSRRVKFVRTFNTKSNAIARTWEFPRIWQKALGLEPHYVIEVCSERFDNLPGHEKEKTIIHELLHISKNFSGALVPHVVFGKERVGHHSVNKLYKQFKDAPEEYWESQDGLIKM